jgi:hypothetical protein
LHDPHTVAHQADHLNPEILANSPDTECPGETKTCLPQNP